VSSAVFPGTLAAMPGLAWSVTKVPAFNSKIQTSVGNAELRASFTPYPRWTWTLKYNFLQGGSASTAFETLLGFWLARKGAYDSFLYDDPDRRCGDGSGSSARAMGSRPSSGCIARWRIPEPIYNVNAITNIKKAGTPTAAYTQAGGLITFAVARRRRGGCSRGRDVLLARALHRRHERPSRNSRISSGRTRASP
jgi:hypothetical protein